MAQLGANVSVVIKPNFLGKDLGISSARRWWTVRSMVPTYSTFIWYFVIISWQKNLRHYKTVERNFCAILLWTVFLDKIHVL